MEKTHLFPIQSTQLLDQVKIKIFADGADLDEMLYWNQHPYIKGLTTNPSLMRAAKIDNYEDFCQTVLKHIKDSPISFEVFSDEMDDMEKQARYIASWGSNVNIKIPVTNTRGEFTGKIISSLSRDNIPLNITAIMTIEQVNAIVDSLHSDCPAILSIFAGRIADTGVDPELLIAKAIELTKNHPNVEILWASTRELLNIFQADKLGCHIITVPHNLLRKLPIVGKDLDSYSLETVQQFYQDAQLTQYSLEIA